MALDIKGKKTSGEIANKLKKKKKELLKKKTKIQGLKI